MIDVDFLQFDGMDLMDFAGPWEVLLTANRLLARDSSPAAFSCVAFSLDGKPVESYGGVQLTPTGQPRDEGLLVVPGTIDVDGALADQGLMDGLRQTSGRREVVTSVCTGAFLLADIGLLADRQWTTHWEDIDTLALSGGSRSRVVDSGQVITAGGLTCGIDLGLHLVSRFVDPELARAVAEQIDYPWA
jgi:transcriptional regulator GlxA family with amidase domain